MFVDGLPQTFTIQLQGCLQRIHTTGIASIKEDSIVGKQEM